VPTVPHPITLLACRVMLVAVNKLLTGK